MKTISYEELLDLLDGLARTNTLIAPRQSGRQVLYQPVHSAAEITWEYNRPDLSIKEALFPSTELLFRMKRIDGEIIIEETLPEKQQIIFGVRPCDARGVQVLDALFINSEPVDPYYACRRENTTLIGLACQQLQPTCFCDRVGGGPADPSGMDIMLTKVGEGCYQVQVLTEAGQRVLPDELDTPVISSFEASNPGKQIPDWPARFDDSYWLEMSERCLSCRACAYVCPTCRCFDIRDEVMPGANSDHYERLRCWDSCTRQAYRRIAGGHNPRAVKGERLRNRFLCKFYYYSQQYPMDFPTACTGCGRCVDVCPVNIDIVEVLDHLMEVAP
jgi:sulfhydrogenase subunit beta (sulfur reductase)